MEPRPGPEPQEQTILEYLKQQLSFKRGTKAQEPLVTADNEAVGTRKPFPRMTTGALVLALLAQLLLEPSPNRTGIISIILYILALG